MRGGILRIGWFQVKSEEMPPKPRPHIGLLVLFGCFQVRQKKPYKYPTQPPLQAGALSDQKRFNAATYQAHTAAAKSTSKPMFGKGLSGFSRLSTEVGGFRG